MNVFKKPRNLFVATFIGSPAMNLIPGRFNAASRKPALQVGNMEFALPERVHRLLKPGQNAAIGIRLTDIEIVAKRTNGALEAHLEVTAVWPSFNMDHFHVDIASWRAI